MCNSKEEKIIKWYEISPEELEIVLSNRCYLTQVMHIKAELPDETIEIDISPEEKNFPYFLFSLKRVRWFYKKTN